MTAELATAGPSAARPAAANPHPTPPIAPQITISTAWALIPLRVTGYSNLPRRLFKKIQARTITMIPQATAQAVCFPNNQITPPTAQKTISTIVTDLTYLTKVPE